MNAVVLVAMADPFRMELVQAACESAGYSAVLANSLEEALDTLARDRTQLVIADEACAELATILGEDQAFAEIPIILAGDAQGPLPRGNALRVDDVQRVVRKVLREAKAKRRQHRSSHHLRVVGDITGAADVHHLKLTLPYELTQAERHGHPLGCVVLHGEPEIIDQEFPKCLPLIRETDFAFRTKPEEIVILLPEADECGVALVVGRLATATEAFRYGVVVTYGDHTPDSLVESARTRVC